MVKTVLITGASGGIGAEIARVFHKNGYNVALNFNRNEKKAEELQKELLGSIVLRGDVSVENDAKSIVEQTVKHFGKIDVLINNAGVSLLKLVTETTLEEWDRIFDINVKGTFLVTKYTVKDMLLRHNGKIINISSMWGISGASCESCYSASKGAVIAFTKALAKELGLSGITVNCIAPGFIDTAMNKDISKEAVQAFCEETPLGRIGNPVDVAKTTLFLASEAADFMTGQVLSVDGGAIL